MAVWLENITQDVIAEPSGGFAAAECENKS
jgi:hypothetical protein